MKKFESYYLSIVLILVIFESSNAQRLRLSTIAEKTVMGLQFGTEVGYRFGNEFTISGFYQRNYRGVNETSNNIYEFAGAMFAIPVARCENLMLSGTLRAGLSNRRFVILTPGVETELKITKYLGLSIGMGIRAAEASASAKITWNL